MARMARTQPSGVDLHARPGRNCWIPEDRPSVAGFFGGGWQAATVRGGTAVAGFRGGRFRALLLIQAPHRKMW